MEMNRSSACDSCRYLAIVLSLVKEVLFGLANSLRSSLAPYPMSGRSAARQYPRADNALKAVASAGFSSNSSGSNLSIFFVALAPFRFGPLLLLSFVTAAESKSAVCSNAQSFDPT